MRMLSKSQDDHRGKITKSSVAGDGETTTTSTSKSSQSIFGSPKDWDKDWELLRSNSASTALAAAKAISSGLCQIGNCGANFDRTLTAVTTLTLDEEAVTQDDTDDDFDTRRNSLAADHESVRARASPFPAECNLTPEILSRASSKTRSYSSLNGNLSEASSGEAFMSPLPPTATSETPLHESLQDELPSLYDRNLLYDVTDPNRGGKSTINCDTKLCLPDKSEFKPDWDRATITAHTMGGCSTLTPAPEEKFKSYDFSNATMIAPSDSPNPFEDAPEDITNANHQHDWINPSHSSQPSGGDSSADQKTPRRKIFGIVVALVCVILVAIAVAVPLAITSANTNNHINEETEESPYYGEFPSIAPTIRGNSVVVEDIPTTHSTGSFTSLHPTPIPSRTKSSSSSSSFSTPPSNKPVSPVLSPTIVQQSFRPATTEPTSFPSMIRSNYPSPATPSTRITAAPSPANGNIATITSSPIVAPISATQPPILWLINTDPTMPPNNNTEIKTPFPSVVSTPNPVTKAPSKQPTKIPISLPPTTVAPTKQPTVSPITEAPTKQPTEQPNSMPPTDALPTSSPPTSPPKESCIVVEIQADEFGYETSWTITDDSGTTVASVEENTFGEFEFNSRDICMMPGNYTFTLRDAYGDGFGMGGGSYKVALDGRELFQGKSFKSEISYDILLGYDPTNWMSERDLQWVEAHNVRRKEWHESHGTTYIPLRWSFELAKGAAYWAEQLLDECDIPGTRHEPDIEPGENLAKNKGDTEFGMGQLYPPENILRRWVDNEATWDYPENAHLTQALWRGSKYLGCGDSVRTFDDGSICRIQVCRYARAGNCGMSSFDATVGDNWLIPMLKDYSPCPPECPPEGCY
ncbi:hypothetical protein ACHAXS_005911 [Conticribra weissflogii]